MKAREEEFCYPARKDNILGEKKTRLELWQAPQRRIRDLGQSVEVFGESLSGLTFGCKRLSIAMACIRAGTKILQDVGRAVLGRPLALLGPVGSMGRMANSFSFFSSKSWWWLRKGCCQTPLSLRKRSGRAG